MDLWPAFIMCFSTCRGKIINMTRLIKVLFFCINTDTQRQRKSDYFRTVSLPFHFVHWKEEKSSRAPTDFCGQSRKQGGLHFLWCYPRVKERKLKQLSGMISQKKNVKGRVKGDISSENNRYILYIYFIFFFENFSYK